MRPLSKQFLLRAYLGKLQQKEGGGDKGPAIKGKITFSNYFFSSFCCHLKMKIILLYTYRNMDIPR